MNRRLTRDQLWFFKRAYCARKLEHVRFTLLVFLFPFSLLSFFVFLYSQPPSTGNKTRGFTYYFRDIVPPFFFSSFSLFMMFHRHDITNHSVVVVPPMKMEINHRARRYVWKYARPVNISLSIILYLERGTTRGKKNHWHTDDSLSPGAFEFPFDRPRNASPGRKPSPTKLGTFFVRIDLSPPQKGETTLSFLEKLFEQEGTKLPPLRLRLKYVLPAEFNFSSRARGSFF